MKRNSKNKRQQIGFIFQDPMTSLTPHMNIGNQLIEVSMIHENASKTDDKKSKGGIRHCKAS